MQSNKTKSHCTQSITLKGEIIWLTILISSGNKLKALEFNIKTQLALTKFPFLQFKEEIKSKVNLSVLDIHSKKDVMTYTLERIIIIKSYCPCTKLTSPHPPCHRGWVWRGAQVPPPSSQGPPVVLCFSSRLESGVCTDIVQDLPLGWSLLSAQILFRTSSFLASFGTLMCTLARSVVPRLVGQKVR